MTKKPIQEYKDVDALRDSPLDLSKAKAPTERQIILAGLGFRKLDLGFRTVSTQWRNDEYNIQINEDIDYATLYTRLKTAIERQTRTAMRNNLRNALFDAMGLEEHSEYGEYGDTSRTYVRIDERA